VLIEFLLYLRKNILHVFLSSPLSSNPKRYSNARTPLIQQNYTDFLRFLPIFSDFLQFYAFFVYFIKFSAFSEVLCCFYLTRSCVLSGQKSFKKRSIAAPVAA